MNQNFLNKFLSKAISNIATALLSLFTTSFITRSVGPNIYGQFTYLLEIFSRIINFLTVGSDTALLVKVSQRQNESKLIKFYLYFLILIFLINFILLGIVYSFQFDKVVFLDIPSDVVLFMFFIAYSIFINTVLRQLNDAYGFTSVAENIFSIQKLVSIFIIFILYFSNLLNFLNFLIYSLSISLISILFWNYNLSTNDKSILKSSVRLNYKEFKTYLIEFYVYCSPIFVHSIIVLVLLVGERWLLQNYGGSVEQGYFGVAYKIGAAIFIISGALIPIFNREFSISWANKNIERSKYLFFTLVPSFFSISAIISIFFCLNSEIVVFLFAGEEFKNSFQVVALMSLYPIHQTYGQLLGTVYFSTDNTAKYRNVNVVFNLIGIILSFYLIAPKEMFSLDLGSKGLAIRLLIIQFLITNYYLYFCTKLLKINFWNLFFHQFIVIIFLYFTAYFSKNISDIFLLENVNALIVSFIIYSVIVSIVAWTFPKLFYFDKVLILNRIKLFFRK